MTSRLPQSRGRLAILLAGLGAVALLAAPALASLTGGCSATVTIDGIPYGPDNDSASNPIVVPDRSDVVASWRATVPFDNNGYSGAVGLVVGPTTITLAEWGPGSGANASEGTYSRQELTNALPGGVKLIGLYELAGHHQTSAGRCEGNAMVRFGGSPLESPVALVALGGTMLSGLGLVGAAVSKGA